ncbi:MAG: histone [Candidatus Micrarchaeaceae archaeon]
MPISKQAARRILKGAGADRINDEAAMELSEALNKLAYDVAKKAVKLASHAKRATVRKEDIELALKD